MRIPWITARREWREYERQEMARVEDNMRDIEAAEAEAERAEADIAARAAGRQARDELS